MNDKLEGLRRSILMSMGVSIDRPCLAADDDGTCAACASRTKELAAFEAAIREDAKENSK